MSFGASASRHTASSSAALEQTEIPPELFLPFRGLSSVPLFFSDYCRKLTTHKGVTITRVIVCTCEHFYLCHPNGDILRCFPFTAVTKILHDESRNQVGIVVPCEFDLALETPLSFQLIRVIDVLRRMHGARTSLQMIRVEPKPRPEGFLGLRPDGTTIWDPKFAKIHNRKNEQSYTDRALGFCGLQEPWIALKDTSYRYYRRAMRSLDLGIEDDDEVLTNTTAMSTAMMANNANVNPMLMGAAGSGGKDGNGNNNNNNTDPSSSSGSNQFTVMLAAGKTSFAFAKSLASRASFSGGNKAANNNNNSAEDDPTTNFSPEDEMPTGYRWFRPSEEDLKKKKEEDEERKRKKKQLRQQQKSGRNFFQDEEENRNNRTRFSDDPEDNDVLHMLLSPMLANNNKDKKRNPDDDDDDDEGGNEDSNDDDDDEDIIVGRLTPRVGNMFDDEGNFIENSSSSVNNNDDENADAMMRKKKLEQQEKRKQKKLLKKKEEDAKKSAEDPSRDQWWPGCQVGWTDGPYALTLAKPKGFKVALDQKNSEFL